MHRCKYIVYTPDFTRVSIMPSDERLVLFGTHDFFIYSAAFNVKSKQLRLVGTKRMSEHPSWLTRHP